MWDFVALNVSPTCFALLYQTGLAIGILESYPDLAGKRNEKGKTALHLLAAKPESFRSVSAYTLNDLGRKSLIPVHILRAIIYWCKCCIITHMQVAT